MATYSIDAYSFISIHRTDNPDAPPPIVQPATELIQRAGVAGSGLINLAARGEAVTLRAVVDLPIALVDSYWAAWRDLVATKPRSIVWADTDWFATFGTKFLILKMDLVSIKKITVRAGGLNSGSNRLVETHWTVCPVVAP